MRRRRSTPVGQEELHESESDFGLSIGDLMSALLLIFVLLLSVTLFKMHENYQRMQTAEKEARAMTENIGNIAQTYETLQDDLYQALKQEFQQDLKRWQAEIDPATISFRFNAPDVLFEQGEAAVKSNFKQILKDFFPRYLKVLRQDKFKNEIEEIRIEGHTSREWRQSASLENAYFGNMQLSQDRTRSVLQYSLSLVQNNAELFDWCLQHITANGLSFSKTVKNAQGQEDPARSRRVEFRVRTNSEKRIQAILQGIKSK